MISPTPMPMARSGQYFDMSRPAMTRPPIIARTSVVAEISKVVCNPLIRNGKFVAMTSQRKV